MLMEMSFNVNIYIFTFFGEFHVMKYKNVKKGLLLGFLPPLKNNSHLTSLIACRCEGFLVLFSYNGLAICSGIQPPPSGPDQD